MAIGDAVYQQIQEINTKLDPRFEGPYRAVDIVDYNKLKINHLTNFTTKTVHLD